MDEGASLRVVNEGYVTHTCTAVDGSFDTGRIAPGESAEVAVGPGVHRVHCTLHSSVDGEGMTGVVVVGDSARTAPVAAGSAAGGVALDAGAAPALAAPALAAAALAVSLAALATARRRAPVT